MEHFSPGAAGVFDSIAVLGGEQQGLRCVQNFAFRVTSQPGDLCRGRIKESVLEHNETSLEDH